MHPFVLIDSGPLVAYYNAGDGWHAPVRDYFHGSTGQFVTTQACITEVMWLLRSDWHVQNEFLLDLARGLYKAEALIISDFSRIAELHKRYADLPADFADLSLIAISERLNIATIATLDTDFEVYRRFTNQFFERVFP